jgi:hypothetical protein
MATPSTTGNIIIAGNVFIAGEYLNICGTIQSGEPDQVITLGSNVENEIQAINSYIQSPNIFTLAVLNAEKVTSEGDGLYQLSINASYPNITVDYNSATGQIDLNPITVQGGHMELYGQIASTGSGQINVFNGYGKVQITNDTPYTLVTDTINTGDAVGYLKITDTAYTDTNKSDATYGQPLVTEFNYENGTTTTDAYYQPAKVGSAIKYVSSYVTAKGQTDSLPGSVTNGVMSYQPAEGQRYYWVTAQGTETETVTNYSASSWVGINLDDPSNITDGPTTTDIGTPQLLASGEYIATSSDTSEYSYSETSVTTSSTQQVSPVTSSSTWYGLTTYYQTTTDESSITDYYHSSILADQPIKIGFIGYKSGSGTVDIQSEGSVIVDGNIQNDGGSTTIVAGSNGNAGASISASGLATVEGQSIVLQASAGIGANGAVNTSITPGGTGTITATSVTGDIDLKETTGNLNVGKITTAPGTNSSGVATMGDVTLTAYGSILAASSTSLVEGGAITLDAQNGSIGSLGTSGTADVPGAGASALNIATGPSFLTDSSSRDVFNATAAGDINLNQANNINSQATGDLYVNNILSSSGDVRVVLGGDGTLVDANTTVQTDPRTAAQLLDMFNQLEATQSTAGRLPDQRLPDLLVLPEPADQ